MLRMVSGWSIIADDLLDAVGSMLTTRPRFG